MDDNARIIIIEQAKKVSIDVAGNYCTS